MRVHQITYGMIPNDAVSNNLLAIDDCLREWGLETALYAQHVAPELKAQIRSDIDFVPLLDQQDDLLIFHYSLYSPNTRLFRAYRGPKILIYHNITPAHFFEGWDAQQALLCRLGQQTLGTLTGADLALGDSEFNRQELIAAGFAPEKTAVQPLFLTLSQQTADATLLAHLMQHDLIHWITVGRIVPNKAIEETIRIFYSYHQRINPKSRLYIIGSDYLPGYSAALRQLVNELDLGRAVTFTGRISDEALRAYYATADLYVTASLHEGFCVPLLESMALGLPILARNATAVPETLAHAGVLFNELDYDTLAELAHLLITDTELRQQIINTQQERLAELSPTHAKTALRKVLEQVGAFL